MKQIKKYSWALIVLAVLTLTYSCKKDSEDSVVAGFSSAQDASNFLKYTFTNSSTNADTYSWNFGDNTALSTEKDPVHIFAAAGTYTVVLTASSGGSSDSYQQIITVTDPNQLLTALTGETSKTWKLIRSTSTGRYPLEVGPATHESIWWAFGRDENLSKRPCMLDDEWTFTREGLKMDYDNHGDYWAEGGLFTPDNTCSSAAMVSPTGDDLSAWGSGSHTFVLTNGTTPTLQVVGNGAFLGLCKVATGAEVKVPQASVTYDIIKLTDGDVDTLVVQTSYNTGDTPPIPAYWRFVLVHYDDPTQEPAIPGDPPVVGFTFSVNGLAFSGTNTSTGGSTYSWDFGDGTTAATENGTHTFAQAGFYTVSFSATNSNGTSTTSAVVFAGSEALTDAALQGAAWKVRVDNMTVFVGDGMGHGNWWSVPVAGLNGGASGGDDWSCLPDDEFTFSAGGVFRYDTKGTARNDGYFGSPNGCIDDAGIAASGNGAAFGTATHSYTFTPASGSSRPLITLTNGGDKAAFIGFYKGYNGIASGLPGGENSDKTKAPNGGSPTNTYEVMGYGHLGGKEILYVCVDFTADHSGHGWSMILER